MTFCNSDLYPFLVYLTDAKPIALISYVTLHIHAVILHIHAVILQIQAFIIQIWAFIIQIKVTNLKLILAVCFDLLCFSLWSGIGIIMRNTERVSRGSFYTPRP